MGSRLLTAAALAVGLAIPSPAAAQQPLTLQAALAEALAANPALRAAAARADQAVAQLDAARAERFPDVTVAEAWQRGTQPVFAFGARLAARAFAETDFDVGRLNHPGAASLMTARVAVRQALFDPARVATIRAERARRDAAHSAVDEARATLAIEVTRAYGQVLAAEAAEAAAAAAASAAREDVQRAERRRDAGVATDAEVLAFSVHAAAMERRCIAAAGEAAVARAEINRLAGQPIDRPFRVLTPSLPAAESGALADLLREAEAQRPDVRRRAAERRASEAEHARSRAAWLPRVHAEAGYQADGLDFADRAGSWVVGGQVSWSISLGGAAHARSRGAAAALRATDALVDDARLALHRDVVAALAALDAARARAEVGRRALAEATERERITRNRYEAGLAGATDVLAAAAAALEADAGQTAALVDATIARAQVDRALGRQPGDATP